MAYEKLELVIAALTVTNHFWIALNFLQIDCSFQWCERKSHRQQASGRKRTCSSNNHQTRTYNIEFPLNLINLTNNCLVMTRIVRAKKRPAGRERGKKRHVHSIALKMRIKKRCKCQWQRQVAKYAMHRFWWSMSNTSFFFLRNHLWASDSLSLHTFIFIHVASKVNKSKRWPEPQQQKNRATTTTMGQRWLFGKRMKAMCTCECVFAFFLLAQFWWQQKEPNRTKQKPCTKVHRESVKSVKSTK